MAKFEKNVTLWERGVIPYEPNTSHKHWETIQKAINEMHGKTMLNFIRRTNQRDYICFPDTGEGNFTRGCGNWGGRQDVYINKKLRALHELGHVVGLIHEHQRPDRDNHITIIKANLKNDDFARTQIEAIEAVEELPNVPYDINSVMHYWYTAGCQEKEKTGWAKLHFWGSNEQRTMTYKKNPDLKFSTPETLSKIDIESINTKYSIAIRKMQTSKKRKHSDENENIAKKHRKESGQNHSLTGSLTGMRHS